MRSEGGGMSYKLAYISEIGEVYRIEYVEVGVQTHGDELVVQVPSSTPDTELMLGHYYDFETERLVARPMRPSPEHEWDRDTKTWILNEHLRREKIAGMVNPVRDYIEASPVQAGEYWVDVDALSEKRMADALEFWRGTSITWTMADNTEVALTESELEQLYFQCRLVRAQRSMALHAEARQLKSDLETTYEQVMDWQGQWLAGSPGDPYYPPKRLGVTVASTSL